MFRKEEKGQGAIEYLLIVGGIIVAMVVIFSLYTSMVSKSGNSVNNPVLFPGELEAGTYRCSNKNTIDHVLSSNVSPTLRDVSADVAEKLIDKGWICNKI
jgi:Flp pilus assembly pilin Flp